MGYDFFHGIVNFPMKTYLIFAKIVCILPLKVVFSCILDRPQLCLLRHHTTSVFAFILRIDTSGGGGNLGALFDKV